MGKIIEFEKSKETLLKDKETTKENEPSKFYKCQKCGNARFDQVFVLRLVTPFEDPELEQDTLMPVPIFQCSNVNCKALVNVL